jgi:hypothetical protein
MAVNLNVARKFSTLRRYAHAKNRSALESYFEHALAGLDVVEDGLKEISFGEYLVDRGVLSRYQLFRTLQMQDRLPGMRLGECAAALSHVTIAEVEELYVAFAKVGTVTVE